MTDPPSSPESRRRFLGRLAATLAAGVGVVAGGRSGARARPAGATNCAIYCQPASGCQTCGDGHLVYDCYSACDGWSYGHCLPDRGCTGYCASQYAC